MAIATTLKSIVRGIGRLPGASQFLGMPPIHNALARLPGASYLLTGAAPVMPWNRLHPFDIRHGTDTSGFVSVGDLAGLGDETARAEAAPYGGSQPSIVRSVLAALPPLDSFTFVDIGCGKGRPLLVASEFPFRDIVGVELSAPLAKTAQRNADAIAERFPQRTPIRVAVGDARRFALPAGNMVLFLYNPFGDEAVSRIAEAVDTAVAQQRRTIYVVYYNPVFGHRFDASSQLHRHFAATLAYAAEELGYGPDAEDPVVVWQAGLALAPKNHAADARIEIVDPKYRVRLVPA